MKCRLTGEEVEYCDNDCENCAEMTNFQPRRGIKKKGNDDDRHRKSKA